MNNEKYKIWLSEFCVEITRWISEGCNEHHTFDNRAGLCYNFPYWVHDNKGIAVCSDEWVLLREWVRNKFGYVMYPFGGGDTYYQEMGGIKLYENEQRLAWIADHIIKD